MPRISQPAEVIPGGDTRLGRGRRLGGAASPPGEPGVPIPAPPLPMQLTLLAVATLTIMAGTIVAPALPAIHARFADQPNAELLSRMVLTLPALACVVSAPVAGLLADRFGRRRLLVAYILLYAVAGSSALLVDGLTAILAGRFALGIAIGGIMTISAALVGDYFEGEARGRFFGLQQAATQLGGVVFVILGGLLADIGWRAPFAVYALALLIVPAAALFLSEPHRPTPAAGPAQPALRTPWPMIGLICVTAFLINMLFYSVPTQIGFYLGQELGLTRPSIAGWAIGALNLASAVTALNYARLRRWLAVAPTFALSLTLLAIGAGMAAVAGSAALLFAAMVVIGLGLGFAQPNILSAAVQLAPPASRGRITGIVTSSMFLGHFVSPIAGQPIIAEGGYRGLYLTVGGAFAVMAGAAAVAAVLVNRPRRPRHLE